MATERKSFSVYRVCGEILRRTGLQNVERLSVKVLMRSFFFFLTLPSFAYKFNLHYDYQTCTLPSRQVSIYHLVLKRISTLGN